MHVQIEKFVKSVCQCVTCRPVWIQRLHPWEWYGFGVVPPVCHPVPPCATLLTAVEEKEVLTQADTPDTA